MGLMKQMAKRQLRKLLKHLSQEEQEERITLKKTLGEEFHAGKAINVNVDMACCDAALPLYINYIINAAAEKISITYEEMIELIMMQRMIFEELMEEETVKQETVTYYDD